MRGRRGSPGLPAAAAEWAQLPLPRPASPSPVPPLPPHRVQLVVHRRNHLPQQPRREAQHPDRDQQHDQIQERPEPLPHHEAEIQRGQPGEHAGPHQEHPGEAEGHHRFAGKAQLEPDGHQVEHAADDAALPRVLRLARPAGVQLDVDLGGAEALPVREHDEEPVPVVPQAHGLENVGAEGLHGVEVADRHIEDAPAERVVDRRNRALAVPSHLPPGDDVPPFLEPVQEAGDLGREVLQVGVEENQILPVGRLGGGEKRLGLALVDPVAQDSQPVPAAALGLRQRGRSVGRAVVHQDDLAGQSELLEGGAHLRDQVGDVGSLVIRGDDKGEVVVGRLLRHATRAFSSGPAGSPAGPGTWPRCGGRS